MPKLKDIIDGIEYAYQKLFGNAVPVWVIKLTIGLILFALLIRGIIWFLNMLVESLGPWFYKPDQKRRAVRRQRFAKHIGREIERLNSLEEWHEYRFAELEAEVEADAERPIYRFIGMQRFTKSGLRREKSLSKAIKKSRDRLIQLEGDPGSGKSVALRFVAQTLAARAARSRSTKSLVPIYINLKELSHPENQPIDRKLIETFVLKTLNRPNDRDIEEYLEQEFSIGIDEGTWLFLFDSFDEIPDILSSTEADAAIRSYADAISDFLSGMNQCRGVLASRHFRGPGGSHWAQFRILPLSEKRRLDLVRKAELNPVAQDEVIAQWGMANSEIRDMIKNPMLLGLLCAHMKSGYAFPNNTHTLFATYIDTRLTRDRDRLLRRFQIDPEAVRGVAENVAFAMAADLGLGLSPSRERLLDGLGRQGIQVDEASFHKVLDALEFIKLGRSEVATAVGDSKPFTFAHRRFQEYFATCVALREPDRVSAKDFITNARWRETAVVMCQTQPIEVLSPILEEARQALAEAIESIPPEVRVSADVQAELAEKRELRQASFPWPPGVLHVLSLLQDGFGRRLSELPDTIRRHAATLLRSASITGGHFDRKWALEVAGTLPVSVLTKLIRAAFGSGSQMLKDVAYRQVARLPDIPADIAGSIYKALVKLVLDGRLTTERHSTHAHLARLDKARQFVKAFHLLLWMPSIDLLLHASLFFMVVAFLGVRSETNRGLLLALLVMGAVSHISLSRVDYLKGPSWVSKLSIISRLYVLIGVLMFMVLDWQGPFSALRSHPMLLVLFMVSVYALIWAPASLLAARTGQFTSVGWWPIMPLVPAFIVAANIKPIFQKFLELKAKLLPPLLATLIFSTILTPIVRGVISSSKTDSASLWLLAGFYLLGFLFPLVLLVRWVKERIRWMKRSKTYDNVVTAEGFLVALTDYSTSKMRLRLIQHIRKNASLVASEETEKIIARLCLRIERSQKERLLKAAEGPLKNLLSLYRSSERKNPSPNQDDFEKWYQKWAPKTNTLVPHEFDMLDELSLLFEQVRAKRPNRPA